MKSWGFYGRSEQLARLNEIVRRDRWFFARVTGRRRIGKTALINRALEHLPHRPVFYTQIPDSEPSGVLSVVGDQLETFGVSADRYPRPRTLQEFARLVRLMVEGGYVVVLDEFQYFSRKRLFEFTSFLQAEVDRLRAKSDRVPGGLFVLGSIHSEMTALLDERTAPLFNRVTDAIDLGHWDIAAVSEVLREFEALTPERLLFLWTLFEGVPKFYRDCHEQGVLAADRPALLRRIFFESSSPLRTEAENWFLHELRGRYDVVLKFVARHPGRMNKELLEEIRRVCGEDTNQIGSYLAVLTDKFRLIERKLPIFARAEARQGRYYLADNFLRAWLAALAQPVSALAFRPTDQLVAEADARLADVEGGALEKLAGALYNERSRKGVGDFPLTRRIEGFWDRKGTEIDLVAVNDDDRVIRFGTCKRSAGKLVADHGNFRGHCRRFLELLPEYASWRHEYVGIAPTIGADARHTLSVFEVIPQDLTDLTKGL